MASKADFDICGRRPASSSANYSFVSMQVCENKGLFIGCKNIFPLLRMPKNQRHLLGFDLLVHFYLQPDRCKRLFLQPPASHPDVQVLKAPSK